MFNIGSFALIFVNVTYPASYMSPQPTIPYVDRQSCVLACIRNKSCSSFFYKRQSEQCVLHTLTYTSRDGLLHESGTFYYALLHPKCPDDYLFSRSSYQCLKVYKPSKTFDGAQAQCVQDNGHLAYSKTEAANKQIVNMFETEGLHFTWLGGNFHEIEDLWYWLDGEQFDYDKWDQNTPGSGQAIYINSQGVWRGLTKGSLLPSICEIDLGGYPCKLLP